ncbi:hypothetical protein [Xenorhabdus ishibashii]|uniref:Phage abortive infection protein n=1 Tax=Xenorhabdus ishibashii TaxID=1034471 RepID=A0A2D0KF38_9GAMM|nr:hypothetical protein [Xenorhabdus ishibashii]PHM62028.1 hypothetical protein Xish_01190 [Xenorhabdus ishibashii]
MKKLLKEYWYLLVLLIIAVIPLALYFYTFNRSLSNNSGDWAAFGSLVGGVWGPLATVGSIIVLIQTLKTMQRNNSQQLKEMQKSNNEQQIRYEEQKEESEITKNLDQFIVLSKALNNVMDKNSNKVLGGKSDLIFDVLLDTVKKVVKYPYKGNYVNKYDTLEEHENSVWETAYNVTKLSNYFTNESIVFTEILRKIKKIEDKESQQSAKIILQSSISPGRRFWFYCHCKHWNPEIFDELESYENFAVIPIDLQ